MITRKDVAQKAHVSTATVSNVINHKPGVSDDLKERVWKAIDELGYQPNLVARSLKTRETRQIALVTNGISNPYFAELALGMEEQAYREGYMVSILNARSDESYMDELIKRQFDGIVLSTDKIPPEQVNRLARYKVPTIFIGNEGYSGFDEDILFVNIDLYQGAIRILEYLIVNGHERIGFLAARKLKSLDEPDYRLKAYKAVLEKYHIPFDSAMIFVEGDTPDYAYCSTCRLMTLANRPTAIFTGNDYLAQGVYAALASFQVRVPYDISVAGFDNLELSHYLVPALTTVHVPNFELGRKVMDMLLRKIRGEKVENINMDTSMVIRQSVRCIKE